MASKLEAFAKKNGVKYFLFNFTDLRGMQRSKLVPAAAAGGMETGGAGFAGFARDCLAKIEDGGLRAAFEARMRALDAELAAWARKGKHHHRARNYAIVVRRAAAAQGEPPAPARKRRFWKKA